MKKKKGKREKRKIRKKMIKILIKGRIGQKTVMMMIMKNLKVRKSEKLKTEIMNWKMLSKKKKNLKKIKDKKMVRNKAMKI